MKIIIVNIIYWSIMAWVMYFNWQVSTKPAKDVKSFRFICSFFMSNKAFEEKDWEKPVPNWQSALVWLIYLAIIIGIIIKSYLENGN